MKHFFEVSEKWLFSFFLGSLVLILQTLHVFELWGVNPNLVLVLVFLLSFSGDRDKFFNFTLPTSLAILILTLFWQGFWFLGFLVAILLGFASGIFFSYFLYDFRALPLAALVLTFGFYLLVSLGLPSVTTVVLEVIYNFIWLTVGFLILRKNKFYLTLR